MAKKQKNPREARLARLAGSAAKLARSRKTHTLIISDIHLGSKVSRVKEVTELLRSFEFKKLILLGDIFEDLNFNRLHRTDWEFISLLGHLAKKTKVRWIIGNHDGELAKIFAALTGAKAYKAYHWQYRRKKYLAIHGHQFDNFLINNAFLSFLASKTYNFIQIVDFFPDKRVSHFLKRRSKGWLRLSGKVARRAILYARLRGADYVFCGHTHKALHEKRGKIQYFNSGSWTDIPATYITIDGRKIEIHEH